MKKTILLIAGIIISGWLAESCSKTSDPAPTGGGGGGGGGITYSCTGISPRFSVEVSPIITTVCAINSSCHGAGSTNSGGPFTIYAEVFAKRSNIKTQVLLGVMPKTGSITQTQINNLICWIDNGALNN